MAANLNKQQRSLVEQNAWILRTKGYTIRRIAEMLSRPVEEGGLGFEISHTAVNDALDRIEDQLSQKLEAQAAKIKARQFAQLEIVQEMAMDGYLRSVENAEQTRTKRSGVKNTDSEETTSSLPAESPGMYLHPSNDGEGWEETTPGDMALILKDGQSGTADFLPIVEEIKQVKGQAGDPRFLAEMRNAMKDQRAIYGLEAPRQQDITSGGEKITAIGYEIIAPAISPDED